MIFCGEIEVKRCMQELSERLRMVLWEKDRMVVQEEKGVRETERCIEREKTALFSEEWQG